MESTSRLDPAVRGSKLASERGAFLTFMRARHGMFHPAGGGKGGGRRGKNKDVVNAIWTSVNVAIRRRVATNKIRGGSLPGWLAGWTITGTELRNKCYEIERQPGRDRARSSNILSVSDGSRPRPFVLRPG